MPEAHMTAHALYRYLEHAKGVDVRGAKAEVLTKENIGAIENGSPLIEVGGFRFPVNKGRIITCLAPGMRPTDETMKRLPKDDRAALHRIINAEQERV